MADGANGEHDEAETASSSVAFGPRRMAAIIVTVAVVVCVAFTILFVAINAGLWWWVLGGIALGVLISWIIAAARDQRWGMVEVVLGLVSCASFVLVGSLVTGSRSSFPGKAGESHRGVPLSATMQYRADTNLFDITDTLLLTDEGSMAVCRDNQLPPVAGGPRADCADAVARNAYARASVEKAGWTYKDEFNGYPRFTRHREVDVDVPQWWPLSVVRNVDAPIVRLENS